MRTLLGIAALVATAGGELLKPACERKQKAVSTWLRWRDCARNSKDPKDRARYSCWHSGWQLTPDEPFGPFLALQDIVAHVDFAESSPYYATVGGPDDETRPRALANDVRGLYFDTHVPSDTVLTPVRGLVSPASVVAALESDGAPRDFDFLKLDLDGFECDILEALVAAGFRPKVVVSEASPAWPPPLKFRLAYDPSPPPASRKCRGRVEWNSAGGEFFYGCSLQAMADLLEPYEYSLVQYNMEDAWFVRDEARAARGGLPRRTPADAYAEGNPHFYFRNNDGNATVSHALRRVVCDPGRGDVLEHVVALFEAHSGLRVADFAHDRGLGISARLPHCSRRLGR